MREPVIAQAWVPRLDVGDWLNAALRWARDNLGFIFDLIRTFVGSVVDWVAWLLHTPTPIIVIAAFTLLAFAATRRWTMTAFTALSFLLVLSMGRFGEAMDSLALVVVAAAMAVLIGVPIGIWASRNSAVSSSVKPVLDFMQTMPSFIYLLLAVLFFRIGVVPGVMASLIFAMPPAVRLTELGIRQVDAEVVEAARAFGASNREVLTGVQLPLARPTIMAGVNQVIMLTLSMVVIAGLAGAPGLGATVVEGVQRLRFDIGIEGGLGVVILAIFLDRITAALGSDDIVRTGTA
jgi:glycine betaine/proline transport system permease protein